MNISRQLAAALLTLLGALPVMAQDTERTPPPAAEQRPAPPPAAEQRPAPPPPAADAEEPRTLEEIFIPSEEIAADEEVTFPIDI